jgi:phosphopentomutase
MGFPGTEAFRRRGAVKRFIVIVLDGFGIGAMDDVPDLRPQDSGANTALHIYQALPGFRLPALESLGLGNAILAARKRGDPDEDPALIRRAESCCFGFHLLAHYGADTFWGHQELMGTRPIRGERGPIAPRLAAVKEALVKAGHRVRFYGGAAPRFLDAPSPGGAEPGGMEPAVLVVDDALTIGDNLETDLGDNYNVTAALDLMPFDKVREIGAIVRSLVHASRVIVFGGADLTLADLLDAYESSGSFAGINAPRSGVYRRGYQVVHLGYGVNAEVQVPAMLKQAGIATVLIGKVADIVENRGGRNIPGVDTAALLERGASILDEFDEGYICINVQETDLAGHREDAELYGERLVTADRGIAAIMEKLSAGDVLVITADHGNDPLIGHSRHTREKTPILAYGQNTKNGFIGKRSSLADTGAAVCEFFGAPFPEAGTSYLGNLLR